METNIFELATRNKITFMSTKGTLTVYEVWDLSIEQLDVLYKMYNRILNDEIANSLLETKSMAFNDIRLKIDIIKHIFDVRQEESIAAKKKKENAIKRQKLLQVLEDKQNTALVNSSIDDIMKMIDELNN